MHSTRARKALQNVASLTRHQNVCSLRGFKVNQRPSASASRSVAPTSWPRFLSMSSSSGNASSSHRVDIFHHSADPPTPLSREKPAVALSFLSAPPRAATSGTVIGWIPATSTQPSSTRRPFGGFVENPQFRHLMHKAIQDGLQKGVDDIQINGALQLQEGWMHIHDDRNIPAVGRIGDPDDIIASVLVQDSKIIPETYQPMPSYRVCTSDGLTKLTPKLQAHLRIFLEEEAKREALR